MKMKKEAKKEPGSGQIYDLTRHEFELFNVFLYLKNSEVLRKQKGIKSKCKTIEYLSLTSNVMIPQILDGGLPPNQVWEAYDE